MTSEPSLSVAYDRAVADARHEGNAPLADHLERLRPMLNLTDDDGERFGVAAQAFARDLMAIGTVLRADPFDMLLILAGTCCHTLNLLRQQGLDFQSASATLVAHLDHLTKQIVARVNAEG